MTYPHDWRRYIGAPSIGGKPPPEFARFAARYKLASSFEGVTLRGMAPRKAGSYGCALGVALAYSALEALRKATGQRGTRQVMGDAVLAQRYRSVGLTKLRHLLESTAEHPPLRERLQVLALDPAADDLMPVASALRHAVLHGDFTAYGAGAVQSKATREFLDALKEALLSTANAEFELYLDRHAIGPWDVQLVAQCPSCRTPIGKVHKAGCAVGRCKSHGESRDQCMGSGRHASTTYWGVYPGTIEAIKRGWIVKSRGATTPNLNRVLTQLTWDPANEQFA
jgi:hypothetical protein